MSSVTDELNNLSENLQSSAIVLYDHTALFVQVILYSAAKFSSRAHLCHNRLSPEDSARFCKSGSSPV